MRTILVVLAAALLSTSPSAADVLVLVDGSRLETRGGWERKGSQVIFERPNGTLSSLPASEVDFGETERAKAGTGSPGDGPEPGKHEKQEKQQGAVLVLTPRDIPQADSPITDSGEPEQEASVEEEEGSAAEGLEVVSWSSDRVEEGGGTVVTGRVRNASRNVFTSIVVVVRVFDGNDEEIGSGSAFLEQTALGPARSTEFRIPFPDVWSFDRLEIELEGNEYRVGIGGVSTNTGPEEE